jgi:hypothetical protein
VLVPQYWEKRSGDQPRMAGAPISSKRREMAGSESAVSTAAAMRAAIGRGMPAGPKMPYQEWALQSGIPASRAVGTSGTRLLRPSVAMNRIRAVPASWKGFSRLAMSQQ